MPTATPSTPQERHTNRSLLFGIGDAYYRVELSRLKGVFAWADLHPSDHRGVLGLLNLRGDLIPVIDLNDIVHGKPTERRLGSRILLLECTSRGKPITIGALASEVFAMARDENSKFAEPLNPCDLLANILAGLP
jgi:chemotaxis signal transduction protein